MEDELLLTDINGKDTKMAVGDLEGHKLPSIFSYRQAYFLGAKAQLAKAKPIIEGRILNLLIEGDILCSEESTKKTNCPACKRFWQTLRGKK